MSASLRARDAVVLTGELGAGKTTFVQGVARGLGIEDQVSSPTFTLVRSTGASSTSRTSTSTGWNGCRTWSTSGWMSSATVRGAPRGMGRRRGGSAARRAAPRRAHHRGSSGRTCGGAASRRPAARGRSDGVRSRWPWAPGAWPRDRPGDRDLDAPDEHGDRVREGRSLDEGLDRRAGPAGVVVPAVRQVLRGTELDLSKVGGIAVGIGPGLFTGLRVGVQTAKSLAQVLQMPIVGLDRARRARLRVRRCTSGSRRSSTPGAGGLLRGYRSVPGGVARETEFQVVITPDRLVAELEAARWRGVGGGQRCDAVSTWTGRARKPDRDRLGGRRPSGGGVPGRTRRSPVPPGGARSSLRRGPGLPEEVRC